MFLFSFEFVQTKQKLAHYSLPSQSPNAQLFTNVLEGVKNLSGCLSLLAKKEYVLLFCAFITEMPKNESLKEPSKCDSMMMFFRKRSPYIEGTPN